MKYTSSLGAKICEHTATSSIGLRHICKELDVPYSTITSWIYDEDHELHDKYADAKQMQLYHLAEEILEIADDSTNDYMTVVGKNGQTKQVLSREAITRSRLRIQARTTLIAKLSPILQIRKKRKLPKFFFDVPQQKNENPEKTATSSPKNAFSHPPKQQRRRKPKPGSHSLSPAEASSAKAAKKKAGAKPPKPQPKREPKYGDPDWPTHLPHFAPYNSKDSWPDYKKIGPFGGGPGVYR